MATKTKKAPKKKAAPKNPVGRPSEFDDKTIESIIGNIRMGVPIKTSAIVAGISESAFHKWMQRGGDEQYRINRGEKPIPTEGQYLQFFQSVMRAKEEAKALHVGVITREAKDGDWRASAWWLSRQYRDEFGDDPAPKIQNIHNTLNITTTMSEIEQILDAIEVNTKAIDVPKTD